MRATVATKKGYSEMKAEQNLKRLEVNKLKLSAKRSSEILTKEMLILLGSKLTPLMRIREWDVVFSTDSDGVSFHTFYFTILKYNPTMIVVKDTKGRVFGGFVTEKWHPGKRFYGTGESFLFTFKKKNELSVYRWTGANDLVMFSDYTKLIIGGG